MYKDPIENTRLDSGHLKEKKLLYEIDMSENIT